METLFVALTTYSLISIIISVYSGNASAAAISMFVDVLIASLPQEYIDFILQKLL